MKVNYFYLLNATILIIANIKSAKTFFPASLIDQVLNKIDKSLIRTEDVPHETTTHDEITQRGIFRSVVDYYLDTSKEMRTVVSRYAAGFAPSNYTIRQLYYDLYGVWLCQTKLESVIRDIQLNNGFVDLDERTKDLPYAHFDAETFKESNLLVINNTDRVYIALQSGDFLEARKRAGRVIHTIQDFYSHSNWVEKGEKQINKLIGTPQFDNLEFVGPDEADPCVENCTFVSYSCGTLASVLEVLFGESGRRLGLTCMTVLAYLI